MLIKLLRTFLDRYRRQLLVVLAFTFVQTMCTLLLPALNASIIDNGVITGDTDYIWKLGGVMLVVTFVQVGFAIAAVYFGSRVAMAFGRDVRQALFHKVTGFSAQDVAGFGAPSLITRITNDVTQVQILVLMSCTLLLAAPFTIVGGVILAVHEDGPLSMLLLVSIPVLLVAVGFVISRMVPQFKVMQARIDRINEILREQITGIRVVRAFVREREEAERFAERNDALTLTSLRAGRLMALMFPIVMLVINATSVAAIWLGGNRIGAGTLQIGSLIAYLSYLIQILMAVMMATFVAVLAPRASVSADRIQAVLDSETSIVAPASPVTELAAVSSLEFREVEFAYPGADFPVLCDITFTANAGETIAIIGSTGAGKTTLLNLVPRLFDATGGAVLVDGFDVRAIEPELLWSRIGLVPQKPYLFSGTVASNLRYANPEATDDELWAALEIAQAKTFVAAMPGKLSAPISQGGSNVSGGQRQRLAIAARPGPKPRYLPLRRLVLRARSRHRCPVACRARTGRRRRGHRDRGAEGLHDHQRQPNPRDRRRPPSRARDTPSTARHLSDLRRDRGVAADGAGSRVSEESEFEELEEEAVAPPPAESRAGFGGRWGAAGVPLERSKDFKNSTRRLAARLRPEGLAVAGVFLLAVTSVTLAVLAPRILGSATNVIVDGISGNNGIDFDKLHRILAVVLLIYVVSAVLSYAQGYVLAGVVQRAMFQLRSDVEDKLNRMPLRYVDGQPRGDMLSRVTNDIDNLAQSLQQTLSQLLTSILTIVGIAIMMLIISPLLAIVVFVTIPVSILIIKAITKRSKTRFVDQWRHTGSLNAQVEEAFTGHSLVKVFGRQQDVERQFNDKNEELYEASFGAQFISGTIQPAMMFLGNLNYVLIALIGGLRVAAGQMSIGDIQAFIQYSRQFTQPLTQLASMINVMQSGIASAERVFELLDAPEEPLDDEGALEDLEPEGRVEFQHVWFSYDPKNPLIEDLSLVAEPGETVAIVGPTGAGKTTLVNLIMRFYDIDSGAITLDGLNISKMRRRDLRSNMGMVLQDTWLFGGTIRENIAYGNPDATEEQIRAAARATYVDRFVHSLPEGYDTVIDDEGGTVSAGEKQLLTIARAFLANPTILILDEATSSVDTRTEVLIQHAMAALRSNRTSFVIAHRLSTIRDADTILVMEAGQIVEQGSHDELLAYDGAYSRLYNAQFAAPAVDVA